MNQKLLTKLKEAITSLGLDYQEGLLDLIGQEADARESAILVLNECGEQLDETWYHRSILVKNAIHKVADILAELCDLPHINIYEVVVTKSYELTQDLRTGIWKGCELIDHEEDGTSQRDLDDHELQTVRDTILLEHGKLL
jgi:hypothetical protein